MTEIVELGFHRK